MFPLILLSAHHAEPELNRHALEYLVPTYMIIYVLKIEWSHIRLQQSPN